MKEVEDNLDDLEYVTTTNHSIVDVNHSVEENPIILTTTNNENHHQPIITIPTNNNDTNNNNNLSNTITVKKKVIENNNNNPNHQHLPPMPSTIPPPSKTTTINEIHHPSSNSVDLLTTSSKNNHGHNHHHEQVNNITHLTVNNTNSEHSSLPRTSSFDSSISNSTNSTTTTDTSYNISSTTFTSSQSNLINHLNNNNGTTTNGISSLIGVTEEEMQNAKNLQKHLIEKAMREKMKKEREKQKELIITENLNYFKTVIMPNIKAYNIIDKAMYKKWYKYGIPTNLRSELWKISLGNELQITEGLYTILKEKIKMENISNLEKQSSSIDLIQYDLCRTFPALQFFQYPDGPYYLPFKTILECYSKFRPDIGYVQGMSYIVATLLLYMDEYDAFVCFCNLLHRSKCNVNPLAVGTLSQNSNTQHFSVTQYLFGPKKRSPQFIHYFQILYQSNHFIPFFTMNTEYLDIHINFIKLLLSHFSPILYNHLNLNLKIEFSVFIVDWFITLFSKSLPLDVVARIWDGYLLHGRIYMYQSCLGILIYYKDNLLKLDYDGVMKFLTHLNSCTNNFEDLDIELLFKTINYDCKLSERKVTKFVKMMK
ncbi:hypothetical protein ABK040_004789 [Willaertia magna]